MSDSVQPHRRQPTRLPRPWDSPGKNTGVACHFLLQCMKEKSESEDAQSCPTLSDPMDCSPPGSSVHGIFQARVLEWGAIAFSGIISTFSQMTFSNTSQSAWLNSIFHVGHVASMGFENLFQATQQTQEESEGKPLPCGLWGPYFFYFEDCLPLRWQFLHCGTVDI